MQLKSLEDPKLFMFSERKNLKLLELLQIRVAYSPIIAVHLLTNDSFHVVLIIY